LNRIACGLTYIAVYLTSMATNNTLLCIPREPTQLSLLQENGYDLVTATNGHNSLQLFMLRPVDAIVIEYHLGLLDGVVVAAEIKQVNPQVPIVMLAEHANLPDDAFKSVDPLVTKSDGAHFLLATLHFVLNVKPSRRQPEKLRAPYLGTPLSSRQVTGRERAMVGQGSSTGN
jgi:DNA-binding response OmpR family regulator